MQDIFILIYSTILLHLKADHLTERRESDRGAVNVVHLSISEAEAVHAHTHITIFIKAECVQMDPLTDVILRQNSLFSGARTFRC